MPRPRDGSYVVPITNRLIGVAVATLYAKNPKAVAKRKQKLMYKLWDGDPATLMARSCGVHPRRRPRKWGTTAACRWKAWRAKWEPDPNAIALLQEVAQAKAEFIQYDRMAKTMELLFAYFLQEQDSGYKEHVQGAGAAHEGVRRRLCRSRFPAPIQEEPRHRGADRGHTSQIAGIERQIEIAQKGDIEPDTGRQRAAQGLMLEACRAKEESCRARRADAQLPARDRDHPGSAV
jgi:hypothetical protein